MMSDAAISKNILTDCSFLYWNYYYKLWLITIIWNILIDKRKHLCELLIKNNKKKKS